MLKVTSRPALLAADNLIALAIIALALSFLAVNNAAIRLQQRQMEQDLLAARLAKEASFRVALGQRRATISRQGYMAVATPQRVVVRNKEKQILEVRP